MCSKHTAEPVRVRSDWVDLAVADSDVGNDGVELAVACSRHIAEPVLGVDVAVGVQTSEAIGWSLL